METVVRLAEPVAPELPPSVDALLTLERAVYGLAGERAIDRIEPSPRWTLATAQHDRALELDLTGSTAPERGRAALSPLFDGRPELDALVSALLDRRLPFLSLAAGEGPALPIGLPAVEEPRVLLQGLDAVLGRLAATLPVLVQRRLLGEPAGLPAVDAPAWTAGAARLPLAVRSASFATGSLLSKVRGRIDRMLARAPHWQLAWRRRMPGTSRIPAEIISRRDYRTLPDDGRRYFGDPFGLVVDGETHVLCEELPYATMKGVISAFTIRADGTSGPTRVVLERPHHLSYPQLFRRDGAIFMMPESAAGNALEIHRAIEFPTRWELVAQPMLGQFHDATLYDDGSRLWITAAVADRRASTWDTLAVFHATRPEGPWTPLAANPVLIDARRARPAGELFTEGGKLYRPAQDCSGGYGGALAVCEVTRLDEGGFAQVERRHTRFAAAERTLGPHTLNVAGDYELIDLLGPRST